MKPANRLFFSSLKQVEKRLKLEDGNPVPPPPPPSLPPPETDSFSSSPIYIHNQHTNTSSTFNGDSTDQPPPEFLSENFSQKNPPQLENSVKTRSTVDAIDKLIEFLGLSDFDGKLSEMADVGDDEFYDKVVQMKGPKSNKEVERLDRWIKYFLNNGKIEPFRLTHLLLAKAALDIGGGNGIEFPSTIDEFLQNDPPLDSN